MSSTLEQINTLRENARSSKPELKVYHRNGETCQEEMKKIISSLSKGATEVRSTYWCDKCNVGVEIVLKAPPDIPYELYKGK